MCRYPEKIKDVMSLNLPDSVIPLRRRLSALAEGGRGMFFYRIESS